MSTHAIRRQLCPESYLVSAILLFDSGYRRYAGYGKREIQLVIESFSFPVYNCAVESMVME